VVDLAETAGKIDKRELRLDTKRNSGGRPEEGGSLRRISDRIGVSPATIVQAQKHVSAVERYPELKIIPTQKDARCPGIRLPAQHIIEGNSSPFFYSQFSILQKPESLLRKGCA